MNLSHAVQSILSWVNASTLQPLHRFVLNLKHGERSVLYVLLTMAIALGFLLGRHGKVREDRRRRFGRFLIPSLQNDGEQRVSRVLIEHFSAPDYHLMNHVTLQMRDGTTQVDHILVSRFGVFVIETKDLSGWIFANEAAATWTQILFRRKFKFQNPIRQNYRHACAVRELLDFLPPEVIKSVVVFTGNAEFKTDLPRGVTTLDRLVEYLSLHAVMLMSKNRLQFCVGRLETARLAISRVTDVEHVRSLTRRHGSRV